ncbi:MAG: phosphoserine phosphatase SerB [Acidimicrobiia bacterium]|nr:phosphoserine phosphatase SerB [Acidimicrobiia bacterium]
MAAARPILMRVSGADRPGITAGLMEVLSASEADVHDVEQMVIRGRLTLDVVFSVPEGPSSVKDLLFFGWEQGLDVDFDSIEETPRRHRRGMVVVTIIAPRIGPAAFGAIAEAVAESGGNIDRIERLSRYPVVSYELTVVGGDLDEIRTRLGKAASEQSVDVAVQERSLERRTKRLVVVDVDSTLIQDEVINLLAEEAGVLDEVEKITMSAMEGAMDFGDSLTHRVALLKDLDIEGIERVVERVTLTPGARTFVRTLKRAGMRTAMISGGFTIVADAIGADLGVDHVVANELEIVEGRVTGQLTGRIVDRGRKAEIVGELAEAEGIPLDQVVAIGDGANDIDMLAVAGLGIAFNAKPVVREVADTAVNVPYLDAILFMLGVHREDVEDADDPEPVQIEGLPPV